MNTSLIILAAGMGTRMNSDLPKVLHPIAGDPMLVHAMAAGATLGPDHTIVVAGHGAAAVTAAAQEFDETATVVVQSEQLGTAHAVDQAKDALADFDGTAIVLYGDTPFVSPETLEDMMSAAEGADVVVLGFQAADPGRYGRLIMDGLSLERIVEFKDANEAELAVTLCNSGVIACKSSLLFDLISHVGNDNAAGEYYLTDIIALARTRGLSATAVTCPEAETLGVNSRAQLAEAEAAFQTRARDRLLEDGVTLQAPETVFLARDTVIGRDTYIEPNVFFGPGVTVESGARLRAFSHLEGCHVARGAVIGPYARLRPNAEIQENARIGNFVEVKNAVVAEGAKVNHLSYIGDAFIGSHANIGAGTITCNYDGVMKHHTHIGSGAFIGSNTMLVAPVHIGEGAMTGSGSVITSDVEPDALALARAPQVEKPGMARKLFEILKAKKAKLQRSS
ncbi:bifunctional UDP-N-acetylglucosamine diphosphorylase/glucosamine-1-phosphate N-acetyltransferase GlmU [uncultured Sulfitobacter sp.]|uniref:bifunctional UDP-N-acetylglucosamine diphosphorylase/glucosamine-1-phosphate N-acetyltransferase GlmU n=1 Tax=uncultured Sulfitobacter sp. TaxID=191468 RepID=UPI00262B499E|nr:bifunctional UDP-N-acetylglucosamine diphosphorylase/glucosamine-1-phosphate N-acetyltransferase GlmU [uncultured Sulfitobacter sp.]